MKEVKDLAIVLKVISYQERHQIITALTRHHGKISAMAHNSVQSRRFGSALSPFSLSEWSWKEKPHHDLVSLESLSLKEDFVGLRGDFDTLSTASFLNELMLALAPTVESAENLFKMHTNALISLSTVHSKQIQTAILNSYVLKLLQWSGTQPRLLRCLHCERKISDIPPGDRVFPRIENAGWFCQDCKNINKVGREIPGMRQLEFSAEAIQDLCLMASEGLRGVEAMPLAPLEEQKVIFEYLLTLLVHHVPGCEITKFKSLRFLDATSDFLKGLGATLCLLVGLSFNALAASPNVWTYQSRGLMIMGTPTSTKILNGDSYFKNLKHYQVEVPAAGIDAAPTVGYSRKSSNHSADYLFSNAIQRYNQGELKDALNFMKTYIGRTSGASAEAFLFLGCIELALNDRPASRVALEKAVDLGGNAGEVASSLLAIPQ